MEISQAVTKGDDDDLVCLQLQEILNKPESVQVIASRYNHLYDYMLAHIMYSQNSFEHTF